MYILEVEASGCVKYFSANEGKLVRVDGPTDAAKYIGFLVENLLEAAEQNKVQKPYNQSYNRMRTSGSRSHRHVTKMNRHVSF